MPSFVSRLVKYVPGTALLIVVAVGAVFAVGVLPVPNALIVAIAFGALVGNTYGIPSRAAAGIGLHKLFLEVGIVLLGARIAISELLGAGPYIFVLVVATVTFGILFVECLSRYVFDVSTKTGTLLAAGSSICGVSAIIAIAGVVKPDEEQLAYVVATVLLFDAVTLVVFPAVGHLLALPGRIFGIWAGLSMFSTGPVAAAGFAYSPEAGQWATVTKLIRNSLIGAVAVVYSLYYARSKHISESGDGGLWVQFPKFLAGFFVVVALANSGIFSQPQLTTIERVSDAMFMLAFAGLGFEIRVDEMRTTGIQPILLLSIYLLVVGVVTLSAVSVLF